MKLVYPAIFKPFSDGSGGYVVEFPDLPGCVTGGNSIKEAMEMAIDAASGWILGEIEDGVPIPEPSQGLVCNEGFIKCMHLDIDAYAKNL